MKKGKISLILLFAALALPYCASAQISAFTDLAFKIPGLTVDKNSRIVRTVDSTRYVTLSVSRGGNYVFVDCKVNATHFHQIEIPREYFINDFRIVENQVVFCGYKISDTRKFDGVIGRFKLTDTWPSGITPVEFYADPVEIMLFTRMTAYSYDNGAGNDLYVAAEGIKDDGSPAMSTAKFPQVVDPLTYYDIWDSSPLNGKSFIGDITSTDDYVACVGSYYINDNREGLALYRYSKSDIANRTGLCTWGLCLYVYFIQQVRATHSADNDIIVATLWHNHSLEYYIFYQTLDLSVLYSTRGQYHPVGNFNNTWLREMTFLKNLRKAVSIVEHPQGTTRHLVFDPYAGPVYDSLKPVDIYEMAEMNFSSIDNINDRYALSFDGMDALVKDIAPNYLHRPSSCVQTDDTLDINVSSSVYESLSFRNIQKYELVVTVEDCRVYSVAPSLVCKTYKSNE